MGVQATPPSVRARRRIEVAPSGCHVYTGHLNADGYGVIGRTPGTKSSVLVHRVMYEAARGPIPDGMVLDHLCRNRACCNPEHLESVSARVNLLRGKGFTALRAQQTHCVHGHEFTPANTYIKPNGTRQCRSCNTERRRALRAKRKSA